MADYVSIEKEKFYRNFMNDIQSLQLYDEEGASLEQIFTKQVIDLLIEAGETENVCLAYDEKYFGTKNQHKINAYSVHDNNETVDLFITVFNQSSETPTIPTDHIETASKRISNFFVKSIHRNYVNEIEESSQIFDLANTLASSKELRENLVRINCIILTNGYFKGSIKQRNIGDFPVLFRVIDFDYIYNISQKQHVPIEIDFQAEGYRVPCIATSNENSIYKSYLAILPGSALVAIYERYGARLLEQNVRSFLQFSGKINKGIRNTIIKEPEMFMAYNNGLSTTAESIEFTISSNGDGLLISKVKDFQIVNGGQTTASLYHTNKKEKVDLSKIFVQVKISVVSDKTNTHEIVSRISEYANTQNKVSMSDLSSNSPFHIALEKLSRNILTPHTELNPVQTRWFYERARGQYKNARLREGFTVVKAKTFDRTNPKNQMLTKEDLAKFSNSFSQVYDGRKLVIGPHFVVRGNQKNYVQFINYNTITDPDNIYYEDLIAKAIVFKSAERIYGVKPNSIGDMRYITVPYAISYLNYKINNQLDLYKIWKNQAISHRMAELLKEIMIFTESFIKKTAPGALYGEWAKKEECWEQFKGTTFKADLKSILKKELLNQDSTKRTKIRYDINEDRVKEELQIINSIPPPIWKKIEEWGRLTNNLQKHELQLIFEIINKIKFSSPLSEYERRISMLIFYKVLDLNPELLYEIDNLSEEITQTEKKETDFEITLELVRETVKWDRTHNKLHGFEHTFMLHLSDGRKELTDHNKAIARKNILKIMKLGFKPTKG